MTESAPHRIRTTLMFAIAVALLIVGMSFTGPFFIHVEPESAASDFRPASLPPPAKRASEDDSPRAPVKRAWSTKSVEKVVSCADCEAAQCSMSQSGCDSIGGAVAGVRRSELCHRVVNCVHETGCASATGNVSDCLCGEGVALSACASRSLADLTGECKAVMAAGLESTSLAEVATRFSDPVYPTGAAVQLIQCGQSLCSASCGFGHNSNALESADADARQRACTACQTAQPICNARRIACENVTGDVHGVPKSELCRQVIDCIHDTNCVSAEGSVSDCICGQNVDVGECQTKQFSELAGACKDVIAAGLESTDVAEMAARFGDPDFAAGLATQAVQCEQVFCAESCGL